MRYRALSILLLAAIAPMTPTAAFADDPANGAIVNVNARYAFVPVGFDDNDEVEVIVDGYLPSGCYRLTQPNVEVDPLNRKIQIQAMARYFDVPCIEALVPYFFSASIGQLDQGEYTVEVTGPETDLRETLPIIQALGPNPDNFLYAPVDDVRVEKNPLTGKLEAIVQGRFTTPCMRWSEARVEDQGKTIVVLPILTIGSDGLCETQLSDYSRSIPLPDTISRGRHLLHVRSLNGQAVNRLFYKQ